MKLQDTLLCVDCEGIYSASSSCPQCGSHVSFPIERALNRVTVAGGFGDGPSSLFGALTSIPVGSSSGHGRALQKSA